MKKRGSFIPFVFILIVGLGLGYYYPIFMGNSIIDPLENSYNSDGWNLLDNERNYDAAIKEFKKYLRRDKSNFYARSGLGWSYYNNQEYKRAIKEFEKVISLNPNHYDPRHGLGWTYLRMDNYEKANEIFSEAVNLELGDKKYQLFTGLGWTQYKLGDYDQAIRSFNLAKKANPDYYFPYLGLVLAYYEQQDYDGVVENMQELIDYPKNHSIPKYKSGYDQDYLIFVNCMGDKKNTVVFVNECGQLVFR